MASHYATTPISRAGAKGTFVAVALTGDTFDAGDDVYLHVKNGSGSSINVTVLTPGLYRGFALTPVVVAVPATDEKEMGPYPASLFTADGATVGVSYSAITTVTAAVKKYNG